MINQLNQLFLNSQPEIGSTVSTPKDTSTWYLYLALLIAFLVLSAICLFVYYKYSLPALKQYKKRQLDDFIKENPRRQNITYEKTGMYLPSWQRAKYNSTLFLALMFFAGAIALIYPLVSA
ncbi:hypothetical protein GE118_02980 [Mycoplasma sp. NEAQ87857]|uniref:hypothetical protein n=1 Tax=Mycoplasma sp. NEAQ87857 TaxID=2683967 RepID=UPI00131850F3|nr:hypothetical protein [Mycoplasma sp. NEAQ87857]QGZ97753.1 hypothetical protein GE118_02980 [Mycoplasma sp. NEAQ87857]